MNYEKRTLSVIVGPENNQIFGEGNTTISIDDPADGEFIVLEQSDDEYSGKLAFDKDEWDAVKEAVDDMFKVCRQYD